MRKGIQLAYPLEEKRLLKWRPPFIVQPKLDGDRARAIRTPAGHFCLLSSEENLFFGVPHVLQALDNADLPADIELDGELYAHRMPHATINGIVSRTSSLHPEYEKIKFHVFDIVNEFSPQLVRLTELANLDLQDPIIRVPYYLTYSLKETMKVYDKILNQGYEGIIVREYTAPYLRRRSPFMMKFKPKKEDHYPIIGYKEEISIDGTPKGRLGALVCETDGVTFSVGSGLNDEQRTRLWTIRDQLPGCTAHIQYQHTLPSGSPRFPVLISVFKK